ncbi:MAG: hypothetical protein K2N23_05415 [Clostridia bacterium]|nr:hypothetical protein [Clostridia bacterium]
MIIFFTLLLICLIVACTVTSFYAAALPILGKIYIALLIACIVAGIVWVIFLAIKIYNELKGKK